jgi:hypothetical protein
MHSPFLTPVSSVNRRTWCLYHQSMAVPVACIIIHSPFLMPVSQSIAVPDACIISQSPFLMPISSVNRRFYACIIIHSPFLTPVSSYTRRSWCLYHQSIAVSTPVPFLISVNSQAVSLTTLKQSDAAPSALRALRSARGHVTETREMGNPEHKHAYDQNAAYKRFLKMTTTWQCIFCVRIPGNEAFLWFGSV